MTKKRKRKKRTTSKSSKPQEQLVAFATEAISVSKTARRNMQSLSGANFYADKLAALRADATIAFENMGGGSVGDTSALAELIGIVFSTNAKPLARVQALRELQITVKTKWRDVPADHSHLEQGGVFPLATLSQTKRGYLVPIGRQANGCYEAGWYDGCAVMMRRLLESSIIEAFEMRGIDATIKDANGDFLQMTALIDKALAERSWNLPRNVKRDLKQLRDLGHRSAHNRYYLAKKMDIDKLSGVFRESVEAFLHLATLL